ncbi:MAG: amino acid permease, partial [Firmicutes bacterium]|nr:amino acid permease [Bacillota bacterium]
KKIYSNMNIVMVFILTICIAAVFAGSAINLDRSLEPAFLPGKNNLVAVFGITAISPWAFIGFESISHLTEEFSFKHSKIFKVFVAALGVTTLLYVLVIILSVTAYPPQFSSWVEYIQSAGSLTGIEALPPFYAAYHYMGSFGVSLLMAALLCLIFTSLIGNTTALSRVIYTLAKDRVAPAMFGDLNKNMAPYKAIHFIMIVSALIPFIGRTAVGWIVDVTTIGAVIVYSFVSAGAAKLAMQRFDRKQAAIGFVSVAIMLVFAIYMVAPGLFGTSRLETATYFLFIVWTTLGLLFFRRLISTDSRQRFGKNVTVWMVLLSLVLLMAIIWMRQSMIESSHYVMKTVHEHYSAELEMGRLSEEELFIDSQIEELNDANTRIIIASTALFSFALVLMLSNHSLMQKRMLEKERAINIDSMTGTKSKHAFGDAEYDYNMDIENKTAQPFAIAVCDVNGLKFINDTYGHKAGDAYIKSAAKIICDVFKHSPVFRMGGDEFAVLLAGADYQDRAQLKAELAKVSESNIGSIENAVVAAGISEYVPGSDKDVHAIFERADKLMYEDKMRLKGLGAKTRD